jgi:hypothetical protein
MNERFTTLEAAAIDASTQGLKSLLILNGGACVALLGFIASLATSEHLRPEFEPVVSVTAKSLVYFAIGAGLTTVAWILAYLSNQRYANAALDPRKVTWSWGVNANRLGLLVAFLSLAAFTTGVIEIAMALP